MARAKKSQSDVTTAAEGVSLILETPVQKTIEEAASLVGCAEIRLLEMLSERLESPEVMLWESVPIEHEALLIEFKQQLEAFNSVRALEPEMPPQASTPVQEPPVLEEEPEAPKQLAKQGKRKSTGLTKQRMNVIQKTVQDTVTLEEGIHTTELDAATTEGIQDGGQIATTYLVAKQVAENKIRKEAAKRRVAKTIQKTAKQKDFDPLAVLQKHGLNPTSDDLAELNELATPAMVSLGNASGEILSNSWANGLQIDCTDLNALMSDAWSD